MLDDPADVRSVGNGDTLNNLLLVSYVLLSLAGLVALSVGGSPFAVDLPNHAARLFIACNLDDPLFSEMYSVQYGLIPNLAIDLLNRPLCGLVDAMTVVRGGMVLAQAGILMIVWKLQLLLHGRTNAFVLLAPAMMFNVITGVGYLNYLIGTFVFLLFAWSMVRYRVLERRAVFAIALANIVGILLFFCHVFALALAVVFLFGLWFAAGAGQSPMRRAASAGVMTIASFAAPLLMLLMVEQTSGALTFEALRKLRSTFTALLFASPRVAAGLTCLWIILICLAFQQKRAFLATALRWPIAFLVIYAVLLPSAIGDAVDLDSRSLASTWYLGIAAIGMRSRASDGTGKFQIAAALLAITTLAFQLWSAIPMMTRFEPHVQEVRSAMKIISPGATILSLENRDGTSSVPKMFYRHLASYATIDRKAFNPLEFSGKGMQPLVVKPRYTCIDAPVAAPLSISAAHRLTKPDVARLLDRPELRRYRYGYLWNERFNYVLYYHFGVADNPFRQFLRPVHQGTFFTIFRTNEPVDPGAPCLETGRSSSR